MCRVCTKMTTRLVVLLFVIKISAGYLDKNMYQSLTPFRECLGKSHPSVCLKEKALDALNDTIMSDQPITFYNMVNIERNPDYHFNTSEAENLPAEATARSTKLSDILYDKIEELFKSRVIKFSMAPTFEEGRGKGGGGGKGKGKGGMMILAMGGMACMVAQMFMGKIAFMAGTALVVAKVALFLSAIVGLKKLAGGGDGGKETSHVVYASGGDHGHSHGGGWHRSIHDPHELAYKAHITDVGGY